MARVELSVQKVSAQGVVPVFTSANADGFFIQNDGHTLVLVAGGIASHTFSVALPRFVDGQAVVGISAVVGAGVRKLFGPFFPAIWNQGGGSGGVIHVDFSGVASVVVVALRF